MKNLLIYLLVASGLASCKPKIDEKITGKGTADFSTYVALGNSLTAGYADGALSRSGQLNSYPSMLSQQFALVGGNPVFNQPLMPDDRGAGIEGRSVLSKFSLRPKADCKGVVSLSPVNGQGDSIGLFTPVRNNGPFNNLGIPGAKSYHLIFPLLGNEKAGNPFYSRFALHPSDSTVVSDAMSINPTFFTLWIGSNDVLLYALYGGDKSKDSITDVAIFNFAVNTIVQKLTSNGAKGAIANLPEITDIPYFTTVPYNGLVLTDTNQVKALNAGYQKFGISFSLGQNPFIIQDLATGYPRKIKSSEHILLSIPQDSLKCKFWGSQIPIPHVYVLDDNEILKIKNATASYNNTILQLATKFGLAFVDMNKNLAKLNAGIKYSGLNFNAQFVTGGAFSLDGIHLNPRGYALVANFYIESINRNYNAAIPSVDVAKYPGTIFP